MSSWLATFGSVWLLKRSIINFLPGIRAQSNASKAFTRRPQEKITAIGPDMTLADESELSEIHATPVHFYFFVVLGADDTSSPGFL